MTWLLACAAVGYLVGDVTGAACGLVVGFLIALALEVATS